MEDNQLDLNLESETVVEKPIETPVKPLEIMELFQKVMQRKAKSMGIARRESVGGKTKYHVSKEKAKAKRKIAKASRKRNRS